ncbi:MAG: GMC family oxidoreductase [Acidobacteria bacterium]|nr:GMC family oxidoreductase [Acidobacteriota bacterium]MYJ06030.1 GMC family oxidoreductase [Acidobacteriota bacterium]
MFLTDGLLSRSYDCYVVGAGPAGITLALELARANRTVLLLESGTATEAREDMPNAINHGHFRDGWWNRHSVRVLGGTSRIWSGSCATPRDLDFDNPAVGVRWPIARSALTPYYPRAAAILDRDPAIFDVETQVTPGFAYRPFSRSGGTPTRFGSKYFETLRTSSSIDVALGTSVIRLDANEARTAVRAVECFHHASGVSERLEIDPRQHVVVAGGSIANAQLLLQPRSDGAVPVGNESGHAGKYLMEHPHYFRVAEMVFDEDADQWWPPLEAAHALVPDEQHTRRHGLLGCAIGFSGRTTHHSMAEYLASQHGKTFYWYRCNVRSEMTPSASNSVSLTGERDVAGLYRPAVRCVIGAGDFLNVEKTLRLLAESLIASAKGRVRIHNERLYRSPEGGGHIMGTTRMGTSASDSVVDADCRVHGYDNLFVAGSSVFSTGGYANPTLTIVALSLRLADALTGAA